MSEELKAALDVLVDNLAPDAKPAQLVAMLLEVYPSNEGETPADTLGRLQAEFDELFEGLIGTAWLDSEAHIR